MEYWALWVVIVILLAIIEASTINLVSIWFIASGIITIFVSLCVDSFLAQFAVFVVLGILLMLLTKPILTKYLHGEDNKTNLDRIIGMEGVVTEEIKKNQVGEVKVDGKLWSAIANEKIQKEEVVKIQSIDGVKLVVEKAILEEMKEIKSKTSAGKTSKKTTSKKTAVKEQEKVVDKTMTEKKDDEEKIATKEVKKISKKKTTTKKSSNTKKATEKKTTSKKQTKKKKES